MKNILGSLVVLLVLILVVAFVGVDRGPMKDCTDRGGQVVTIGKATACSTLDGIEPL